MPEEAPLTSSHHIVVFPFMAQGHTIPLLYLCNALSSMGHRSTIITTPLNAISMRRTLDCQNPKIRLIELPFPEEPAVPRNCENTDQLPSVDLFVPFLKATQKLRPQFDQILEELTVIDPPICIVSDFFHGWTLDSAKRLGIPRLVFHGMGAYSMSICKSVCVHYPQKGLTETEPFRVPGMPSPVVITRAELSSPVKDLDPNDRSFQLLCEVGLADIESDGVLVNTFYELEPAWVDCFEGFYKKGSRAWCVGPLCLYSRSPQDALDSNPCIDWLGRQEVGSVVYVSFGTQVAVSRGQMREIALGLERSGAKYLWVVRGEEGEEFEERENGLIARVWVPQVAVLCHVAIGGFMSHCGWNSVLESLVHGVPILGWGMIAEQQLNAKVVEEVLGVGIRVLEEGEGGNLVEGEVISGKVAELMRGERGRKARRRAAEVAEAAREAGAPGGSSYTALANLVEDLAGKRR
ncbi:hypothetical protein AMTRI_Chr12g274250 [Amborella trichopoda]